MVDTACSLCTRGNGQTANRYYGSPGTTVEADGISGTYTDRESGAQGPTLSHKVKNQKSILALVVSDSKIYAGTQDGEIKVCYCSSNKSFRS